ncbi:MAG TPA: alpha/beta hydrolase [Candidatus Acidoferrum sp.]|jgi:pimeloyl-ACP methyl ester carboxylesterase
MTNLFTLAGALGVASLAYAQSARSGAATFAEQLGVGFESKVVQANGTQLHYVRGGDGPPLILIHGFPQDWFEYRAVMPRLAKRFTVVAVDLRGIGGSAPSAGGYDAATMAEDIHQLISLLKLEHVYMVGHDIGGQVAYALVRRYPEITRGAMILDTAIPGIDGWDVIQGHPAMWHMHFMQVPRLAEKLVSGRQSDYLAYFFQFGKFTPDHINHYAKAYGTDAQLHAAFEIYRAFPANAQFNARQHGRNEVPLFFGTGDGSPFAKLIPTIAEGFRSSGFTHVETGLIRDCAHYVVDDQPEAVSDLIERYASK